MGKSMRKAGNGTAGRVSLHRNEKKRGVFSCQGKERKRENVSCKPGGLSFDAGRVEGEPLLRATQSRASDGLAKDQIWTLPRLRS